MIILIGGGTGFIFQRKEPSVGSPGSPGDHFIQVWTPTCNSSPKSNTIQNETQDLDLEEGPSAACFNHFPDVPETLLSSCCSAEDAGDAAKVSLLQPIQEGGRDWSCISGDGVRLGGCNKSYTNEDKKQEVRCSLVKLSFILFSTQNRAHEPEHTARTAVRSRSQEADPTRTRSAAFQDLFFLFLDLMVSSNVQVHKEKISKKQNNTYFDKHW